MGIPKFYRWISERYPLISQSIEDGSIIPEYDNLYLDFNGIIHRCSHPDDINPLQNQLTESDMILKMFDYVQKIVRQIKPRKVLIIAVDGVAPRAKMNQQRSRRFRSAQETAASLERARKSGADVPPAEELFDSNCITPGTEFMEKLNAHFEYFIRKKISEDETWKHLNVIFSGHDVPGEGEHKIMSFIRKMKSQLPDGESPSHTFQAFCEKTQPPNTLWDPNATHCFYGLDADLIMLSLVTHEPHFSILRENVLQQNKPVNMKSLCSIKSGGRGGGGGGGNNRNKGGSGSKKGGDEFQLLHLSIVREYLHEEFQGCLPAAGENGSESGFTYDLERIIDDFVFMCYFIGNDFLPNLPFLDISDEALNRMFVMYRENVHTFGDYLTHHGTINPASCRKFLEHVSIIEKEVLGVNAFASLDDNADSKDASTNKVAQQLSNLGLSHASIEQQRKAFRDANPDDAWKQGYYMQKFKQPLQQRAFHDKLRFDYLQGLAWVLKYYYTGCQSWAWYYPYHYAPLATDLLSITDMEGLSQFPPSQPFEPFQQLLGVLPIASKRLLPVEYQKLMSAKNSPLKSFYPEEFKVDLNGKRNDWEAVVLIPFIDEDVLRQACLTIDQDKISQHEKFRNRLNRDAVWYFYETGFRGQVASTLPGIAPLRDIPARKELLALPEFESDFRLCEGVLMGPHAPSHFPTMQTLPFSSAPKFVKVSLFRGVSRKDTLVIKIEKPPLWDVPVPPYWDPENEDDDDCFITDDDVLGEQVEYEKALALEKVHSTTIMQELAEDLLGKSAYANWPYHEEVRIVELCCQYKRVNFDGTYPFEPVAWQKTTHALESDYLSQRGMELGPLQILVRVEPLAGMSSSTKGQLTKLWNSSAAYWYPYQILVSQISNSDPRYDERPEQSTREMFPLQSTVVITKRDIRGALGTVTGYVSSGQLEVEFHPLPALSSVPKQCHQRLRQKHYSIEHLSHAVHSHPRVVSQITGQVWLKKSKTDLGLNLKFSGRNEKALGYTDRIHGQWFFTQKALDLLIDYHRHFPQVFQALQSHSDSSNLTPAQIFGSEGADGRLKELKKWLKAQGVGAIKLCSADQESMSVEAIAETEKTLEKLALTIKKQQESGSVQCQTIKRNFLQLPLTSQIVSTTKPPQLEVGDYVSYLRPSSGPAFGSIAVVVAYNQDLGTVHLLFGKDFIGGCDLDAACSSYRGLKDVELRFCLKLQAQKSDGDARLSRSTPLYEQGSSPSAPSTRKNNNNHNNNSNTRGTSKNTDRTASKNAGAAPPVKIKARPSQDTPSKAEPAKPRPSNKGPTDKSNKGHAKQNKPRGGEKTNKPSGGQKNAPSSSSTPAAQDSQGAVTSTPAQTGATPALPGGEPHRVVNEMPPRGGAQKVVKNFFVPPSTGIAGGHDLPLLTPDQLEQPPPNQVPMGSTSYHPSTYFVPSSMAHAPVYGWMPPPPGSGMPMPYGYPYGMMPQGMPQGMPGSHPMAWRPPTGSAEQHSQPATAPPTHTEKPASSGPDQSGSAPKKTV